MKRTDDLNSRKDFPTIGVMKRVASAKDTICKEKVQTRLPTDHISFEPPARTIPFQKVFDLTLTKPGYSTNFETGASSWVPKDQLKTVCNKSSVAYNIIAHTPNTYSGAEVLGVLDKKVTNRKKGVAEFSDLIQH